MELNALYAKKIFRKIIDIFKNNEVNYEIIKKIQEKIINEIISQLNNYFKEYEKKMEEKIYNIQKSLLEKFKQELSPLTSEYEESIKRANDANSEENKIEAKKQKLKIEAENFKRMYEEAKQEINKLKEDVISKLKVRNEIKDKYPKEYEI